MRTNRPDGGFTLVELLVAVIIIGIIAVPLGNVIITYLRNSDQTTARMSESHDVQIASAYFARDVASLGVRNTGDDTLQQSIETDAPATGGVYPCGTDATPSAVVRFAWDEYTVTQSPAPSGLEPTTVIVAYVVMTQAGQSELHRIQCDGAGSPPTSDVVLVHNFDSATVACESPGNCEAFPDVPQRVTLTLTVAGPGDTGSPYTVTLSGQRRQS